MRSLVRSSAHLLLPALLMSSALTLGAHQDPPDVTRQDRRVDGVLQTIRVFSTSEHGVPRPSAMTWSSKLDALVLTDADRPRVHRAVQPDETDVGRVPAATAAAEPAPVAVAGARGHDLRGASIHPETGHLFTYDATTDEVLEVRDDVVVAAYDATDLSVDDVRGIVIAPSADSTDHPSTLSFYVVDNGAPGNFGEVVEATVASDLALMAAVTPSSVRVVDTSAYSPPSPDPSGVAYLPGADRLFISDGEVDEMSIFRGVNLFTTTRPGAVTATGVSQPWSDEPVGVGYNPGNNHLFVSDDDQKEVFELVAGADGRFGTSDDTVTHFDTLSHGAVDPEGLDYDPTTNSLWFAGGEEAEVHRLQAAGDGRFGTADDIWTHWDAGLYGMQDPEGLGFDTARGTVVVVDDSSQTIYELDRNGALLNTIDVSSANMNAAAGLAVAPASNGSGQRTYYVVARGQDNDSHPTENDGKLYEITASLPPLGGGPVNQAPSVDAGSDLSVVLPASASLDGTVSDDGLPASPGQVTTTWSQVSGPGTTTFGNENAVDTSATFSTAGTYVLRLSASDGQATMVDEVTVFVAPAGGANVIEARVSQGADDVEQAASGFVGLTSSDLELTTDGSTQQVVGVRFTNLQVPQGAQVLNAYVQFWTDEVSTGASAMNIKAEASDNTPTYVGTNGNVTNRATTVQSVPWSPPDWNTVGQAASAQRTPDLSTVLQAVVGRAGWSAGNAMALQFSGTGRRTARAFESGTATAPLLHVEYSTGGGGTTNQPPSVNAGGDASVQLPASASLDGTVSDDGLPASPGQVTTTWSQVSGPGTTTFGNVNAVDTTASFSTSGTYVLRLSATDGQLSASDDVTIVVQAASATNQPPSVNAGGDASVQLPASASLDGTVSDDGLPASPGQVTTTWSQVSGPGTATFGNVNAVDTTASFSTSGTYVLRLSATDGQLSASDDVTIVVQAASATNQPPSVNAGGDASVQLPASASLDGTVSDDGLPASPGQVTTTWSQVSGPGTATFGNVNAVDTTASFSTSGTYVLRLSATDGQLSASDDVTIVVQAASGGGATTVERRVVAGSDDAEQAASGFVGLTSSDLELTTDGSTQQVVGVRFTNLQVPQGAQVTNAYVQFRTDEVSTGASAMTIRAEAADNTPTYVGTNGNVTSRTPTSQSVPWSPPDWNTVGQAAAAQQTPNLSTVLQAVVGRPGWSAGNALALQFSGTGRRTAEAFEGGASFAPLLHVEYTAAGGGPTNQPPVVDAGTGMTVQLPASASLDGTVSDDGLPASPGQVTTTWSQVSGPGTATFGNVNAVDTTASFSTSGTYVLRLSATDGQLSASDDVTIVVQAAGGGGGAQTVEVRVAAGSDDAEQSVGSGKTSTTSSDLELTTDGNTQQVVGIRFASVAIPAGAQITNAYLQFATDEVSTGASALTLRAENLDNTATYTNTVNAVTGRATTSAFVPWSPPDWTTVGQAAAGQRTPDLSALVQAVVNRAGWGPGNALAFQVSGTGVRKARSFEGSAAAAPLLHVEYTTG